MVSALDTLRIVKIKGEDPMWKYRFIVGGCFLSAVLCISSSLIFNMDQVWQVLLSWLMGMTFITVAAYYSYKMSKD
ncbi:hypothetical protein [Paenibacillus sp. 481]|uniref:hypothetical protein n=1 Tax=Paenibacillus sp. 481 TaxID=2835869 RepID=UPI001E4DFAE8|nr:hypothetical protein [Paenibacillus sp. 481]UHA71805.1 hypothetical protein KIK04_13645 [Paenibacillus sp. 481]